MHCTQARLVHRPLTSMCPTLQVTQSRSKLWAGQVSGRKRTEWVASRLEDALGVCSLMVLFLNISHSLSLNSYYCCHQNWSKARHRPGDPALPLRSLQHPQLGNSWFEAGGWGRMSMAKGHPLGVGQVMSVKGVLGEPSRQSNSQAGIGA